MNDNSDLSNDTKDENLHFNTIGIINKIQLKKKLNNKLENDKIIYISGKMYSHTTVGNYLFQACDFYLFSSEDNKLYHSIMNSNDCFTNTLKWTSNFFKRIRASLNSKNQSKKFYFIISEINDNNNDDIEINNKKFFELHFIIKKQDITSFRLLLEEIVENEPNIFFSNKIMELNKELEDRVREKEDNFKNKKNEMITKFYLLIDEKNQKIEKLQKETKKQNKKNK